MAYKVLDGELFRQLVLAAEVHLGDHKKEVDALNVFPVPDGDTGTNMFLTLSAAAQKVREAQNLELGEVAEAVSMGALMGARGNSGVILSQILRGFAKSFSGKSSATALELSQAFNEAVNTAYKAVMRPVEGTILTVLRGARDGALEVARPGTSIDDVLNSSLSRAREVLAKTPDMLPVLKQAGVVDAGGRGLVFILEGMLKYLFGGVEVPAPQREETASAKTAAPEEIDIENPYDTQFLIVGQNLPIGTIRAELEAYGDSLLVVGSMEVARVHIHTKAPGEVLTLCLKYGSLSQVTIDNMIEQSREAFGKKMPLAAEPPQPKDPPKEVGVVSVACGEGLKEVMLSLGCDLVIDGGVTMNPSTSEVAQAVKSVNAKKIIFLPNNGNIFLAAKQAKKLTGRNMYIVPTRTIPQGIAALMSLNLAEDMEHNLKRASKALKHVRTGEITFAARASKFGRYVMKEGDIIGLVDGKVDAVGSDPAEVLVTIVKNMIRDDDAVVTVYYGKDVDEATASRAAEKLRKVLPDEVEVELYNGGQPLYYYLVSVE